MGQSREIIDIRGNKRLVDCLSCAIEKGEVARYGGSIASTLYFDAHQDWEIPIPGFVILASRRHLQSVDEFTREERADFIDFICRVRKVMRQALNIQIVYLIQEEDTSDHFHVWLFPRYEWMAERFGRKIQSVRVIMEYARENLKTEENLAKVDEAIKNMRDSYEKLVAKEGF